MKHKAESRKPVPLIEVRQADFIPGFAAFAAGSVTDGGPAKVVLNVGDLVALVHTGEVPAAELPYIVAESIMHEVVHVLEEWAGVEFSEERVEDLIARYTEAARSGALGPMQPENTQ